MSIAVQNPFAHLGEQEREKLAKELDAIHDEVFADLGDRDRRYIKSVIKAQRQIVVAGEPWRRRRLRLLGSQIRSDRHRGQRRIEAIRPQRVALKFELAPERCQLRPKPADMAALAGLPRLDREGRNRRRVCCAQSGNGKRQQCGALRPA